MNKVKEFFKNAFEDMKERTKAQHEVDKANFAAAKAESKAQWEEAKAMAKPEYTKKKMQAERDKQIAAYIPLCFGFFMAECKIKACTHFHNRQ